MKVFRGYHLKHVIEKRNCNILRFKPNYIIFILDLLPQKSVYGPKNREVFTRLSSQDEAEEKDVPFYSIKRVSVNYRPGNRILSALKHTGFKKVFG